MRFSGVIIDLFPPVKPVSKVANDKADRSLICLCNYVSSGHGASD